MYPETKEVRDLRDFILNLDVGKPDLVIRIIMVKQRVILEARQKEFAKSLPY